MFCARGKIFVYFSVARQHVGATGKQFYPISNISSGKTETELHIKKKILILCEEETLYGSDRLNIQTVDQLYFIINVSALSNR
jgi:hypothetical protein